MSGLFSSYRSFSSDDPLFRFPFSPPNTAYYSLRTTGMFSSGNPINSLERSKAETIDLRGLGLFRLTVGKVTDLNVTVGDLVGRHITEISV